MNKRIQLRYLCAIVLFGTIYCFAQDPAQFSNTPVESGRFDEQPAQPSTTANSDPLPAPIAGGRAPEAYGGGVQALPSPASNQGYSTQPGRQAPVPSIDPASGAEVIAIPYTSRREVMQHVRMPDGRVAETMHFVVETQIARVPVDADLDSLELPPEGKRVAVLTITAARHKGLLEELKAAKAPQEREAASEALKENYTAHYAIETWWREQKLAELQARLAELQAQVTQRQESEEKYVEAAMTIAQLWADGIGITPPTPSRLPVGSTPPTALPGPQVVPNSSATIPVPLSQPGPITAPVLGTGFRSSRANHGTLTPAETPANSQPLRPVFDDSTSLSN